MGCYKNTLNALSSCDVAPWVCCGTSGDEKFALACEARLPMREGVHLLVKNNFLLFFLYEFEEKVQFFSPNPLGNQPINTTSLIHKSTFRTKQFKEKNKH